MIDALDTFALLRPYWLLSVPLVVALAWWSHRRRGELGDWSRAIDAHLMQAMDRLGRIERSGRRGAGLAAFLAAGTVGVALTGPAVQIGEGQSFRNLDGVVFVMDVSPSMTRDPRWHEVVTLARAGLSVLATRPAALIVFAGDSYEAATLTTDHRPLGQTIALLTGDTVPDRGSRPALGLRDAAILLSRADILAGDVVLFSDGAGLDDAALAAARDLKAEGARLIVAHLESEHGDASGIERLIRSASAERVAATDIDRFMDLLGDSDGARFREQDFGLAIWTDYGRFLLCLALVPLAGLFRRRSR